MAEKITKEIFEHMVDLAALELDEDESEYLRRELNNQLAAIDELAAIPIPENIEPASHGVPYKKEISAVLRKDEAVQFENSQEILSGAPEIDDDYFSVPDIPHEELE